MSYLGNEPPQLAGYSAQTKAAPVGSSITLNQEGTINSTLLFLDGVRQTPTTDYTISGTTLTLTSTAPTTAVATILFLGDVTDIGTPSNDTVAVDQLNTTSTGSTGEFLKKTGAATIDWDEVASGIAWQAVQTTGFTAVAGKGYPCNTTAGAFTVTLPSSASVGDEIALLDYAGTFDTNEVTLDPNGLKLKGATVDLVASTERQVLTLTYVDVTQGWLTTSDANSPTPALNIVGYAIDYLVVAGGGGNSFGGGGGGGFRTSTQTSNVAAVITATVGAGGASRSIGIDSSITGSGLTTITSTGGGHGGGVSGNTGVGGAGGSGGGGGHGPDAGGAGNTPSTSPVQGYAGGTGQAAPNYGGGGGGGAGAIGTNSTGSGGSSGGNGGAGAANSITGASVTYGGGGAGSYGGAGGAGGGGGYGGAGTANTGGGAGGYSGGGVIGGSGIIILSVPTARYSGTSSGAPTITTSGANTILSFTGTGTYTA